MCSHFVTLVRISSNVVISLIHLQFLLSPYNVFLSKILLVLSGLSDLMSSLAWWIFSRSFIFTPFYVIVWYLRWLFFFSSVIRDYQNLKKIPALGVNFHWEPVNALHALSIQYLFTLRSHFNNLFWTSSKRSLSIFPLQLWSMSRISFPQRSMGDKALDFNLVPRALGISAQGTRLPGLRFCCQYRD